jgi:hypothetical protein
MLSMTLLTMALAFGASAASSQDSKDAPKPGVQSTCCADSKAQMGQMDEHMKRMQALHEKMASATTPEARQKLMNDQRLEMQHAMAMMQGMSHGGPMMGGAGMGTGMAGQKSKPADQKTQMQMMERRMDMMQMMMQTMLDQQGVSGSAPMQAPAK